MSIKMTGCNSTSLMTTCQDSTTDMDVFPSDLSLESIQEQLNIGPSFLPKEQNTIDVTESGLTVNPDLIFINDNIVCDDSIDLNNIQLYLECFDDSENLVSSSSSSFESNPNLSAQTGTSVLKSDVQFKISFPVFPEERDKGYKCCTCKMYFDSEDVLRSHVLVEHKQKTLMCPFCFYNTKSKKFFNTHIRTKHKGLAETANQLFQVNRSTASNMHQRGSPSRNERENITDAYLTNTQLGAEISLIEEINGYRQSQSKLKSLNDQRSMLCENIVQGKVSDNKLTDKEFTGYSNQAVDQESITTDDEHVTVTPRVISSQGDRSDEILSNMPDKFVCKVCNFVTKSSKLLKMHKNAMHNSHRKLFYCSECSYICKQKRTYMAHTELHKGSFSFKCDVCSKTFVSKSNYTRHRKNHTVERQYKCHLEECTKAFKTKGALTDHKKKVHSTLKTELEQMAKSENPKNYETCAVEEVCLYSLSYLDCKKGECEYEQNSIASDEDKVKGISNNDTTCVMVQLNMCGKTCTNTSESTKMDACCTCTVKEKCNCEKGSTIAAATHRAAVDEKCKYDTSCNSQVDTRDKSTCTSSDGDVSELNTKHRQSQCKQIKSKSFICPYGRCQKIFRDNFNLRNHLCTHEGVKKITCDFCDFKCIQKSSLNYHIKSKHSDTEL